MGCGTQRAAELLRGLSCTELDAELAIVIEDPLEDVVVKYLAAGNLHWNHSPEEILIAMNPQIVWWQ